MMCSVTSEGMCPDYKDWRGCLKCSTKVDCTSLKAVKVMLLSG